MTLCIQFETRNIELHCKHIALQGNVKTIHLSLLQEYLTMFRNFSELWEV